MLRAVLFAGFVLCVLLAPPLVPPLLWVPLPLHLDEPLIAATEVVEVSSVVVAAMILPLAGLCTDHNRSALLARVCGSPGCTSPS